MTAQEWTLVKSVFSRALEVDAAVREQWLSKQEQLSSTVAAEVRRLIVAAHSGSSLEFETAPSDPIFVGGGHSFIGEVLLDRFEVIDHLGSGAMGDVYSAYDRELKETIAFKTLRRHLSQQAGLVLGLRREVQLARRVRHVNVCQLFDLHQGTIRAGEPLLFFTMELLMGQTLAARLTEGPLAMDVALHVASGLAAGLEAIHAAGLIHRDLKPGNVFLMQSDGPLKRVVIADFGLCFDERRPVAESLTLFGPDAVIGTPSYMAPEQLLGKGATQRSDIYAFGVVLFEMLTGRLPFEGETPLAVALKRLSDRAPSPRVFASRISSEWERAILACLQFNSSKRPASAGEVMLAIDGKQSLTSQILSRRRFWLPGAAVLSIAAAVKYGPRPHSRHMPDPKAEYHLKLGQEYSRQSSPEGIRNAIVEMKEAVSLDAQYGEAWANLADVYCMASTYNAMKPSEARKLAESTARRAISLDPSIGRAHAAYAYALSTDLRRWRKAESFFKEAIKLNPNDPSVRSWYAGFLGRMSRFNEAVPMAESALQLDPGSFRLNYRMATELFRAKQFERLLPHMQRVVRLHPAEGAGFCMLGRSYEWLKRFPEAEEALHHADELPDKVVSLAYWATLWAAEGSAKDALRSTAKIRANWVAQVTETNVLLMALGALAMLLGEKSQSAEIVAVIREGMHREDETVLAAAANPYMGIARGDPGVVELFKTLDLA